MIIQEVSEFAPQKLKDIEETFKKLKISHNNKKARINLVQQIKDFTKIQEVVLFIDNEYNAGVITVYKSGSILNILKSFLTTFQSDKEPISPERLKGLSSVEESADMIERIYIFIGKPLLKVLSPRELVAVLLHEFGHVFSTTSSIPGNILFVLKQILKIAFFSSPLIMKMMYNITAIHHILIVYLVISALLNGITFTEHIGEYGGDNYALKYGYGDELISALNKFGNNREKAKGGIAYKIKDFLRSLVAIVQRIVAPTFNSDHPDLEIRIKKLEEQIFNEFKKIYPKYKEIFDLVRSDYRLQEAKVIK